MTKNKTDRLPAFRVLVVQLEETSSKYGRKQIVNMQTAVSVLRYRNRSSSFPVPSLLPLKEFPRGNRYDLSQKR